MKSFKTEIYTLDVLRLSAIYGERLKYGTIEEDRILNLDGDVCYKSGERARVLEINGDDYILESEGKFILTKEELIASQIKNLENSMKRTMEHDLIAQGYTQDEVKRIISSRSQKKAIKNSFGYELWLEGNMLTSDDGFADEDEAMEEAKAEAQSRLEEWQSEGHSEDYTVDDFDIEITEEDDDDDDDLFNACGKKKGKKKAIKSELEEPTEDEEVHMNTAADRQWAEEKKLANARRAKRLNNSVDLDKARSIKYQSKAILNKYGAKYSEPTIETIDGDTYVVFKYYGGKNDTIDRNDDSWDEIYNLDGVVDVGWGAGYGYGDTKWEDSLLIEISDSEPIPQSRKPITNASNRHQQSYIEFISVKNGVGTFGLFGFGGYKISEFQIKNITEKRSTQIKEELLKEFGWESGHDVDESSIDKAVKDYVDYANKVINDWMKSQKPTNNSRRVK